MIHSNFARILRPAALAAVLAFMTSSAFAANPAAGITKKIGTPRPTGAHWVVKSPAVPICDQMGMITSASYDSGNGNAISGQSAFGQIADLQAADDCNLTSDYFITQACGGYVTFAGGTPATALWLQVYAQSGGAPAATATSNAVILPADITATSFTDPIFGLAGRTVCGDITTGTFQVNTGTWYFDVQPVDTTAGGDWYYQCRDLQSLIGSDAYGRDGAGEHGTQFGGPYAGGYGTTTWTSMAGLGFGAGDAAQLIAGDIVPVELQSFEIE
jgi:hypothetical protein